MDNFQETELHKLHLRLVALEGTAGHALHLAPSHKVGLLSNVPFEADTDADPIKAGDSVRVIGSNNLVDPKIHFVGSVAANGDIFVVGDANAHQRNKVVRVSGASKTEWTPAPPKR